MRIAVRNGSDSEWRRISISREQDDSSTQRLVHRIPELISIDDLAPGQPSIKVCSRNLSSSSEDDGSFIGIDHSGHITIVECRDFSDPANRSEIIGQVLECAALLWGMSYEGFNNMVMSSEGRALAEIMSEKVPAERWSEESFRKAVTSSLNQGRFRLLIAVPEITEELRRIITFLSARGPFSFETYVVELQHFFDGETEIVAPRLTSFAKIEKEDSIQEAMQGASQKMETAQKPSSHAEPSFGSSPEPVELSASTRSIVERAGSNKEDDGRKEALFFAKCQGSIGQNATEIIGKLYTFSAEVADSIIWWGPGGAGAFNFVLTEDQLTVFIVDANGKIMFNFSEWQREPVYRSILPQFLEKLKDVSILRQQKGDYTRWPDFDVEEFFADQNDFMKFENSVKFLKEKLCNLAPA